MKRGRTEGSTRLRLDDGLRRQLRTRYCTADELITLLRGSQQVSTILEAAIFLVRVYVPGRAPVEVTLDPGFATIQEMRKEAELLTGIPFCDHELHQLPGDEGNQHGDGTTLLDESHVFRGGCSVAVRPKGRGISWINEDGSPATWITKGSGTVEKGSGSEFLFAYSTETIADRPEKSWGICWTASTVDKTYGMTIRPGRDEDKGMGSATFRLLCDSDGILRIMQEYGGDMISAGPYEVGDRLAIKLNPNNVSFHRNTQVIFVSERTPNFPMQIGIGFQDEGAKAVDVRLSEGAWAGPLAPGARPRPE